MDQDDKKRKYENIHDSELPLAKEEIKKLLEPLTKEQLIDLLLDASLQYPGVSETIRETASRDPAHRKLFVRGLAWETNSQTLRDAFTEYGEIEEGAVIADKATGKSRGFGFITYKHMDSAYRALKEPSKRIDGRLTVCNLAAVGSSSTMPVLNDAALRKVYIGGLSYETTSETVLAIFSQYGEIEEGAVAYDKGSNKSRGFAFVTFKSIESARRAISESNKTIEGRQVVVKIASESSKDKSSHQSDRSQQLLASQSGFGSAYGSVTPTLASLSAYRPSAQLTAQQSMAMAYSNPALAAAAAAAYGASPAAYGALGSVAQYAAGNSGAQYSNPQQLAAAAAAAAAYGQAYASNNGTANTGTSVSSDSLPLYFVNS